MRALAVWGAVTLFLTVSQRLNVYYGALLAGATLVEAARYSAERFGTSPVARRAAAAIAAVVLALPMADGLAGELRAIRVPGSDLFATLDWMRRVLPHEMDAYDPRLLGPVAPPGLSTRGVGARALVARPSRALRDRAACGGE